MARVTELMRRKQQQRRADAFAAALAQVFGDLRDGANAGRRVAAQLLLYRDQVFAQKLEDFSSGGYG